MRHATIARGRARAFPHLLHVLDLTRARKKDEHGERRAIVAAAAAARRRRLAERRRGLTQRAIDAALAAVPARARHDTSLVSACPADDVPLPPLVPAMSRDMRVSPSIVSLSYEVDIAHVQKRCRWHLQTVDPTENGPAARATPPLYD